MFNMTLATNESEILFENLEKWTVYCFSIAGFTLAGPGPNDTQCSRTLEDGTLHRRILTKEGGGCKRSADHQTMIVRESV